MKDQVTVKMMAEKETPQTKKHRKKRPKTLVTSLIIVVILVGGIAWYRYNMSPAEGTILNQQTASSEPTVQAASTIAYSGMSVSFAYPALYTNQQKGMPSGIITEQMSFSGRIGSQESRKIGLTVKQMQPGVHMQEDAAYKMRLNDTINYTHSTVLVAGTEADVFTRKNGTEITYIIPGSGKYAIFSGTTTSPAGQLASDMDGITKSFQWQ